MKTTYKAKVIYTKDHIQHVVFTTPECELSQVAREIAEHNLNRLLKHAEILRVERASLISSLITCNTANPFESRTPLIMIAMLKNQLVRLNAILHIDMHLDDCHIQYSRTDTPDEHKLKVASTFKYVEIIHDVVDTLEEAKQVCDTTRERFKKRIEREELLLSMNVTSSPTTLYWLKRQLNEGFKISPVTIRC